MVFPTPSLFYPKFEGVPLALDHYGIKLCARRVCANYL